MEGGHDVQDAQEIGDGPDATAAATQKVGDVHSVQKWLGEEEQDDDDDVANRLGACPRHVCGAPTELTRVRACVCACGGGGAVAPVSNRGKGLAPAAAGAKPAGAAASPPAPGAASPSSSAVPTGNLIDL
jgi:hypothetical protein